MKKLLLISILLFSFLAGAQDSTQVWEKKYRIEPGLILGGDFYNNGVLLSFIPYFTYDLVKKPNLCIGVSPNLSYFTTLNGAYSSFYYGGSVLAKIYFAKDFYFQLENELLSQKFTSDPSVSKQRRWLDQVFIGGGYRRETSFGYSFISGFYNLNYKFYKTIYPRPLVVRAGIGIRLNSAAFPNAK